MALSFTTTEISALPARIRTRIAEGANVWETTAADLPDWLAGAVGTAAIAAVFVSAHAGVAVLENGQTVVRRAPRA